MQDLLLIAADYVKGKPVYPPLRRVLSLLFTISIASFIYERTHGPYEWLMLTQYQAILDFLIKGLFFIPFSIFVIVHFATLWFASWGFTVWNDIKSMRWMRSILNYKVHPRLVRWQLHKVSGMSKHIAAIELTPDVLARLYAALKPVLPSEEFAALQSEANVRKEATKLNFVFFFRALVAVSLYAYSIPQFGWLLYGLVVAVLVIAMYVTMLGYRLYDVLPTLVSRFVVEAEKFFSEQAAAAAAKAPSS